MLSHTLYTVPTTVSFDTAFKELRGGYPDKPFTAQVKGGLFRKNAQIVLSETVREVIDMLGCHPDKITAVLPWRSALAFVPTLSDAGVTDFYHLNSKRNEETLETETDFEEGCIKAENQILIADPMLATGNTIIDAIKRLEKKHVPLENITVVSILAAPEGIRHIHDYYPKTRMVVGKLDEKLDERGYIVPGLGDFGDKYFFDFGQKELLDLVKSCKLSRKGQAKLIGRFEQGMISDIPEGII